MKKFSKVCLIIVGVLLGLGILFCGISSLMGAGLGTIRLMANNGELNRGNWHIDSNGIYYNTDDNDLSWEWDSEVSEVPDAPEVPDKSDGDEIVNKYAVSDIDKMDLDIGAVALALVTGEDTEHVVVTLKNGKDRYYDVGLDGNTLDIEYEVEHTWLFDSNDIDNDAEIIIEIPAGMNIETMDMDIGAADVQINLTDVNCGKLLLDVGAASVVANEFNVTELLDVTVGAGDLEINGGSYEKVKIDCGVGNCELSGTVKEDLTVDCGLGNTILKLEGKRDDYNYKLSCGMGSLMVNGDQYSDIAGSHNVTNDGAIGTIDIDCGMGNVEVEIK